MSFRFFVVWSRFGSGGAYIFSVLVQMSFWCFLFFGVMFLDVISGEERPADIIPYACCLELG